MLCQKLAHTSRARSQTSCKSGPPMANRALITEFTYSKLLFERKVSLQFVEQAVPPHQLYAAGSPHQDPLMQRAHRISLMQSSDAGGFATSWGFDGLMQAGSPLRRVLMQAGWPVFYYSVFFKTSHEVLYLQHCACYIIFVFCILPFPQWRVLL